MERELISLISTYEAKVNYGMSLLESKFGNIVVFLANKPSDFPKRGVLDKAQKTKYYFHGRGCRVEFGNTEVNFDFYQITPNGIGFNVFWLLEFITYNKSDFPHLVNFTIEDLQMLLDKLESKGIVRRMRESEETDLYFLNKTYASPQY